jgi:aminopeptidase N
MPRFMLLLVLLAFAAACGRTESPGGTDSPVTTTRDIHSYARPDEARVTHVALDLRADFTARTLSGQAALTLQRAPGSTRIVLDTRDLTIESVTDANGRTLTFSRGQTDAILGQPLDITLPDGVTGIIVRYRTSPSAAALQWLTPEQTAGRQHPYLYSQGQAILTRTWIPTQDSPGIRQTYTARIVVPKPLRAVMSAEQLTPDGVDVPEGRRFEFRMNQPIPPYLIAIGVGDIAFKSEGARTGVYAEPSLLADAAAEFVDLEKMVSAAESLLGPYRWGRYDLLVLPPSFPFGGMENPRLTFATPTIIAGDRSLVSLVAHELAHSWSGNLVTNATWSDFWLNEGVTTYVESRIMEALYGKRIAEMLLVLERAGLQDEITRLGGPTGRDTILHVDLQGRNPDDGMTDIPYSKGAALLRLMEQTVGREPFDAYLRGYFDRHAFKSITTDAFLADLRSNLIKDNPDLERQLRLDEWINKPGLPDNAPLPRSDALDIVAGHARAFAAGARASSLPTKEWTTQEWQHFLDELPATLSTVQLEELDRTFGMSARRNSEILFSWLRIAIRHRYEPAFPALDRFLTSQGRRKFLRPLYEDLMKTDWGAPTAKAIYRKARPLYHTVATATLDSIVGS